MAWHRRLNITLWSAALWAVAPLAGAAPGPFDGAPVPDARLEATRGGFDGNLAVSLGLERLVTINGEQVASTRFEVADLSRVTHGEAALVRAALAPYQLVQNGAGNGIADAVMASGAISALLIQNSLGDQLIRSQTTINASVNTLAALKGLGFEGSLRQALAATLAPR